MIGKFLYSYALECSNPLSTKLTTKEVWTLSSVSVCSRFELFLTSILQRRTLKEFIFFKIWIWKGRSSASGYEHRTRWLEESPYFACNLSLKVLFRLLTLTFSFETIHVKIFLQQIFCWRTTTFLTIFRCFASSKCWLGPLTNLYFN